MSYNPDRPMFAPLKVIFEPNWQLVDDSASPLRFISYLFPSNETPQIMSQTNNTPKYNFTQLREDYTRSIREFKEERDGEGRVQRLIDIKVQALLEDLAIILKNGFKKNDEKDLQRPHVLVSTTVTNVFDIEKSCTYHFSDKDRGVIWNRLIEVLNPHGIYVQKGGLRLTFTILSPEVVFNK